jgi:hypothetical protein
MAAIRWHEDAHLFTIAVIAFGLGLYGYQARRRHRPGLPAHHGIGSVAKLRSPASARRDANHRFRRLGTTPRIGTKRSGSCSHQQKTQDNNPADHEDTRRNPR